MFGIVKYVTKKVCTYFVLCGIANCVVGTINSELTKRLGREQTNDYVEKIYKMNHL